MYPYLHRTLVVYENPEPPIDTGIIDMYGKKIYKHLHPEPIGFIHFEEPKSESAQE